MDCNSNSVATIDATDSPVNSLVSSFGQLEITTHNNNNNTGGPINRLPNETMQLIVAKLGLDGDVNKLIRLRLVSTRWRAMIEYYCGQKKSLIVALITELSHYYLSEFEERFFGNAKLNDFTRLHLSIKMPSKCLRSLLKLFPNVVKLSIYCEDQLRVRDLFEYIKSLDSLKQLDLNDEIVKTLPHLSRNILSKLELIVCNDYKYILNEDDFCQFISHLGPDCVCLNFVGGQFNCEHILQWHSLNPTWLSNVTHLQIANYGTYEWHSKVVHQLTQHATSLKYFKANFQYFSLDFTPTVIRNFGKLTHLVELELWNISMNIFEWERAPVPHEYANSQSSLLLFKLYVVNSLLWEFDYVDGDQFTRILSTTFPNLTDLDLTFKIEFGKFYQMKPQIEHNLYRFPKMRKHKIDYYLV